MSSVDTSVVPLKFFFQRDNNLALPLYMFPVTCSLCGKEKPEFKWNDMIKIKIWENNHAETWYMCPDCKERVIVVFGVIENVTLSVSYLLMARYVFSVAMIIL